MNIDDRVSKRTRGSQRAGARRGKVKMWKNWQRVRRNNISTLMLRCVPTKLTGDAAPAAPERMQTEEKSMNGFASSKTEVFEKIEESFRQCRGSKISMMTRSRSCA